jgi:UDP-glucuronate 4-epimerase
MALWLFTESMLAGRPIKVFNHGRMRRDFTYIDDIIAGVKASLFTPDLAPYEIFNLGNHQAENLMDMIGILSETLGVKPITEFLPMQPGDVEATYADISLAGAKLGFHPSTSITRGIPRFVKWYREYHQV